MCWSCFGVIRLRQQPPKMVRAVLWQYWFSTPEEKRTRGCVVDAEAAGDVCADGGAAAGWEVCGDSSADAGWAAGVVRSGGLWIGWDVILGGVAIESNQQGGEMRGKGRWVVRLLLLLSAVVYALGFLHLRADFPNGSPWMDWSKMTDEGWYAGAAIHYFVQGRWYLPGSLNPAVAMPVWPAMLGVWFAMTGREHDRGADADDGAVWGVAGAAVPGGVAGAAGKAGGGGGVADGDQSVLLCVRSAGDSGAGDGAVADAGAVAGG